VNRFISISTSPHRGGRLVRVVYVCVLLMCISNTNGRFTSPNNPFLTPSNNLFMGSGAPDLAGANGAVAERRVLSVTVQLTHGGSRGGKSAGPAGTGVTGGGESGGNANRNGNGGSNTVSNGGSGVDGGDYAGGHLHIGMSGNVTREKGAAVIYPAYMAHKVHQ
jgi:hypothetical protein